MSSFSTLLESKGLKIHNEQLVEFEIYLSCGSHLIIIAINF